jgi:ribose/xylose/arabinose/galactoside ABC-type transport system permease subunit
MAWLLKNGSTPMEAILGAIGTGCLAGLINGALISMLRVVPFIVTLGTMTIYLGLGKIIGHSTTVRPLPAQVPDWISQLLSPRPQPEWLLLPLGVWLVLLLALAVSGLLRYTVFGRHLFALGSSEATARLCGVNVPRTRIAVYTLAGFFVGISGIFLFSRLSSGDATSGTGRELSIIAAVVIGGASLSGGRGSVLGTLTGALIMQVISNGCTALRLPNPTQEIIIGAIIVGAVTLDQVRQHRL